ncbi:hypothetical protein I3679_022915 [Proteus mirabilis]|uniref:Uncharacterized protein n=1 Tax=Proteus mirabilis TaxID=584 RepID=A0ABD5LYL9_PROMI
MDLFRSQTVNDAWILIQQLFSAGAWQSLQAEGLTLFMFWGLFLLYPCFVTLRAIIARLEKKSALVCLSTTISVDPYNYIYVVS